MSGDVRTSFLTYYIRSLAERTRHEKSGTKYGFDWIIYNLALADNLSPCRLPFIRGGPDETSKTKTEPEFGIDFAFLSADGLRLTVFVLKDEVLSNANWKAHDFDPDLRAATTVDLSRSEFMGVCEVKVVLAYNQDEDQAGVEHYDRLTRSLGTKVRDNVHLSFERWNLTTLVEKVQQRLVTPSLLPQPFFSLFNYICSQFADPIFRHGSDEWTQLLVPNWRHFLGDALKDQADERTVRLLPVALLILREQGKTNPTSETGWLELAEWAILAAWRVHQCTDSKAVRAAVSQMWIEFYLSELEIYYEAHMPQLATEHGLQVNRTNSYLDSVAAAVTAFWHIGRIGILALSFSELLRPKNASQEKQKTEVMRKVANWLASLMNANPAALRPLIDLHHIELFLTWRTFWQLERRDDIFKWLHGLRNCLLVRRAGIVPLPFIEGGNSLELVFECVATGEKPPEFSDQSSLLLLCILELCFGLERPRRNELISLYYQQIVLGRDSSGEQLKDCQPLDLMGWAPPEDWGQMLLSKSLAEEGESQTLETFNVPPNTDGQEIATRIEGFIRQSRNARKTVYPDGLPESLIVLACLKHRSPLPAEIWRRSIFGTLEAESPK